MKRGIVLFDRIFRCRRIIGYNPNFEGLLVTHDIGFRDNNYRRIGDIEGDASISHFYEGSRLKMLFKIFSF